MPGTAKTRGADGLRGETDAYLRKLAFWSLLAWAVFSIAPVGGSILLFGEHFRRAAIVESGEQLMANVVTRRVADARWGRVCRTVYAFDWAGRRHISDVVGCRDEHPVGGRIAIAFDPADPARAFALFEGTWAGGPKLFPKVFPFILIAAFAALTWYLVGPALRAIAELRRRRRTPRES